MVSAPEIIVDGVVETSEDEVKETSERRLSVMARSTCANGRYLLASSCGAAFVPASCISMSVLPLLCPFRVLLFGSTGVG